MLIFLGFTAQILGTDSTEANCMIMARNSPIRPMINQGIQMLRQTGTLDILKRKWNTQLPNSAIELKTVLSTEHTAVVFFAFGASLFLSTVLLVTEVIVSQLLRRAPAAVAVSSSTGAVGWRKFKAVKKMYPAN